MRLRINTIILIGLLSQGARIDAEDTQPPSEIVELIEKFEQNQTEIVAERLPVYREELRTGGTIRQRMVASVALGLHYLDKMNLRLALQYLAIARELHGRENTALGTVIRLGFARIRYSYGDYESAVKEAKKSLKAKLSRQRLDDATLILVKGLMRLGRTKEALYEFENYHKKRSLRTSNMEILRHGALVYREFGNFKKESELLESMAQQYPMNPEAIWAFNQLKDYNCEDAKGKRKYYFSKKLLRRLAINRKLDPGLNSFLFEQTGTPIRVKRRRPEKLKLLDRVDLLLRMSLYKEASAFEPQILELLKVRKNRDRSEALPILARVYNAEKRYQLAARYYSMFLSDYPRHRRRHKVRASLGNTLSKMGAFQAAAENYAFLAKKSRRSSYKWEHFWNTYLAGNHKAALELIDRKSYVRLKDPKEPLAIDYWRGRLHEKLGDKDEAMRHYRRILNKDATSFYANLVLAKHPEFWSEMLPETVKRQTANTSKPRQHTRYLAMDFHPAKALENTEHGLKLLKELVSAGLDWEARDQLRQLNDRFFNKSAKSEIENIAYYLADYKSYRRFTYKAKDSNTYPRDLTALVMHKQEFTNIWKANYPLAFDGITDKVANFFGLSKFLLLSLMRAESSYDVFAQSWVGARGLMQIMPKTAIKISELVQNSRFKVEELYEPSINLTYGAFYINWLMKQFQNNPFVAIASYNAGPIAVNHWLKQCQNCEVDEFIESIPYQETRRYVKSVVRNLGQYSRIYQFDQPFWAMPDLPPYLPDEDHLF